MPLEVDYSKGSLSLALTSKTASLRTTFQPSAEQSIPDSGILQTSQATD